MKPSRLLLAVLAIGAVTAGFFLLRSEPAADRGVLAEFAETPDGSGDSASARVDLAAPTGFNEPTGAQVDAALTTQRAIAQPTGSGTHDLLVRVHAPGQAPDDDALEVIVCDASLLDGDEGDEFLERLRSEGDPKSSFLRASVGTDGVATLEVPEEMRAPRLLVDGRYLFVPEPVEFSADVGEVDLMPSLGGLIAIRLAPASGLTPNGKLRLTGGSWGGGGAGRWHRRETQLEAGATGLEFRAVDPDLTWMLEPNLDGQHADLQLGLQVEPGRVLELTVNVSRGAAVLGRVVDEAGQPLADVQISAGDGMPWLGGLTRETNSNGSGKFALRGLPPGVVELEAELEGWRSASTGEITLEDGEERSEVTLTLERGLTIAGIVRAPNGAPAPGARVAAERLERQNWGGWGGSQLRRAGETESDGEGRFSISGLDEGNFTVRAELDDEGAGISSYASLEGVLAGGPEVTLDLQGPVAFVGRVVDDLDEPVTAFAIEVESIEEGGPEERQTYDSSDGRFRFARVGPGTWNVRVEAEGYVHGAPTEHALPDDGAELRLIVERTAELRGRVVDSAGTPVARATVSGSNGVEQGFGNWGGPQGPRTETDSAGMFVLDELSPGALVITASAEGWADSEPLSFELPPGERLDEIVLTLRVGGRIEGQVVTPEGDPLSGQRVTWGANAMGFAPRGDTTSDSGGRFDFDHVTPGEWAVSAVPSMEELREGMRGGGQSSFVEVMGNLVTKTVAVADGELVEVFLGGEPRQPVRIFGSVTRDGEPLGGADVFAVSENSAVFEGMKSARAASDGSFELIIDRPGPYTFSANVDNVGVERVVDVPREEELRVDLAIPLGRIEGRVREPDGSPAKGVRLALQRDDGLGRIRWSGGQATVDESGTYAFEDLEPGLYTVRANAPGWGGTVNERFGSAVIAGVEVLKDRATRNVNLDLEAAGTLAGVVVGEGGEPIAGASLYFRNENGRVVSRVSTVVSDAAGRFEKTGLAPGTYTISARAKGWTAGDSATARVESGETAEARVQLEPGTYVVVRLEDENKQARRARVEVLDGDGNDVAGLITMEAMRAAFNEGSATMQQRVGPIPPGRYTLRATTAGGEVREKRVRVRSRDDEKTFVLSLTD